tara:strand:+ start:287 stop:973 length:687 start_codon:yes stop_codon:yes gene_type:complete
MSIYLHIPKTAGTALRNAFLLPNNQGKVLPFHVASTHNVTVYNSEVQVFFSIRDPLERFCSGYWERFTNPRRRLLNNNAPLRYQGEGYNNISSIERDLFKTYKTPNELLTAIREDTYDQKGMSLQNTELNLLLAPLKYWTGDLNKYKLFEKKVGAVFDQTNLSKIMKEVFNIEMPNDPFLKRSRDQFPELNQTYEVSNDNKDWFIKTFRKADYRIIEYIRSRPYYIEN